MAQWLPGLDMILAGEDPRAPDGASERVSLDEALVGGPLPVFSTAGGSVGSLPARVAGAIGMHAASRPDLIGETGIPDVVTGGGPGSMMPGGGGGGGSDGSGIGGIPWRIVLGFIAVLGTIVAVGQLFQINIGDSDS